MRHSLFMRASMLLVSAALVTFMPAAHAEVKLPAVFSSHMVLQQQRPVVVWGTADPGEEVAVQVAADKQRTKANSAGEWRVSLAAMPAGGPHTMTVTGRNTLTFVDVMVGEVWLCSGQSNMEMGVGVSANGPKELADANHPNIRLMMVPKTIAATPQANIDAKWIVCTPENLGRGGWGGFSAAGYYFGRELNRELNVPVGLIQSAWGGTRIEPWTPAEAFAGIPSLKSVYDKVQRVDPSTQAHKQALAAYLPELRRWIEQADQSIEGAGPVPAMPPVPAGLTFDPKNPQTPTGLYNAMIHPLVPFAIRGAIWYQGESNASEGMLYVDKTRALVDGWRKVWNDSDMPYYFVQIAPYTYGSGSSEMLAEFWEAQAAIEKAIPNTGMAVINDIGDLKDIHPTNKQEVGRRLALLALARTYGKKDIVCSGPVFKTMEIENHEMRLTFDGVGAGLISRDGKPLRDFEVIDANTGGFVKAEATIVAPNALLLRAQGVTSPVAVRFGWRKLAQPNLSNKEGLPAMAFRAGPVPKREMPSPAK